MRQLLEKLPLYGLWTNFFFECADNLAFIIVSALKTFLKIVQIPCENCV